MRATNLVRAMAWVATLATTFFTCAPPTAKTYAARVKNVAVVDTRLDIESGASAVMNADEVREITDELRREAIKNLPRNKYNIMTTETVYAQGGAVVEECSDENCAVILGNKIGADYVVRGTIRKFQTMLTLSVEMYETENGNLVAISDPIRSERPIELLGMVAGACGEMYRRFENPKSSAPKSKSTPEPTAQRPIYQTPTQSASAPTYQTPSSTPSYQQSGGGGFGTFTDSRDGRTYKMVRIGGQTWMAENLNYQTSTGSWCNDDDNSNCGKYGRLYVWYTAKTACPLGWRLPSSQDWDILGQTVGGKLTSYKKNGSNILVWERAGNFLKSTSGWDDNHGKSGNGTNNYGFSALPSGWRSFGGSAGFLSVGSSGCWWTTTEVKNDLAYSKCIYNDDDDIFEREFSKGVGHSVRCLQGVDNAPSAVVDWTDELEAELEAKTIAELDSLLKLDSSPGGTHK